MGSMTISESCFCICVQFLFVFYFVSPFLLIDRAYGPRGLQVSSLTFIILNQLYVLSIVFFFVSS